MRIGVLSCVRQRQQLRGRRHQLRGQRQLAAETVNFVEVVREDDASLRSNRMLQRLGDHVGIAVAIAADPGAETQERRQVQLVARAEALSQISFQRGIELGHLGQKCVAVIGEPIVDFVEDAQLGQSQHRRLPQSQHFAIEPDLQRIRLVGRQNDAVAPLQQPRDLALAIENAFPLHLGGMRGQHRAHQRIVEPARKRAATDPRLRQPIERVQETSDLRCGARQRMDAAAAVLMHVLGDVHQMREIRKRPHDIEGLGDRELVEQRIQLAFDDGSLLRARAPKTNGGLPDRFDAREALLAGLRAQYVAQYAAEEARVFLEGKVFIGRGVHG